MGKPNNRKYKFSNHLRERYLERIGLFGQLMKKSKIPNYVSQNFRKIDGIMASSLRNAKSYFYRKTDNNPTTISVMFEQYKGVETIEFLKDNKTIFVNVINEDKTEKIVTCYDNKDVIGYYLV